MRKRCSSLIFMVLLVLAACVKTAPASTTAITPAPAASAAPVLPVSGLTQGTGGYGWWNDTTFYEIFVRSFYDSNGDGIGDLNGITQKLDYLTSLGITGLWLMPINPAESYHGYDVTDYYAVNPDYGTLDDFKTLLNEAHKRGIRIILDLVLNHTSIKHPWFQQGIDPQSPYHDWYIWSATDQGYRGPWGEQVWYPLNGQYYYSIFWSGMADLNLQNPAVTAEMGKVTKFWLDLGVDGFRLDAAKHLVEQRTIQADSQATHAWLAQYYAFYKSVNPNALTVGELSGDDAGLMADYINNKQLDLAFDFGLASSFIASANQGDARPTLGQIILSYKLISPLQFATFLTNHDQNRLMTQLGSDPNRVKTAAALLLTAPGVPFLYYGEEVGLEGAGADKLKRRPMQWSADSNAGFSTAAPWEPVGEGYQTYNVANEDADAASILNTYRRLIQVRSQHAALRVGEMYRVTSSDTRLYSILRVSHTGGVSSPINEAVLVLINLSATPLSDYTLTLDKSTLPAGSYSLAPILGMGAFTGLIVASSGDFAQYQPVDTIPAYGTLIIQLQINSSGK